MKNGRPFTHLNHAATAFIYVIILVAQRSKSVQLAALLRKNRRLLSSKKSKLVNLPCTYLYEIFYFRHSIFRDRPYGTKMVDLIQFSLVDRSRTTENHFCPKALRTKEISYCSKIFNLFTLFCLLVWAQNAFQPANAQPIPKNARERRSPPFSIDPEDKDRSSQPLLTGEKFIIKIILYHLKLFLNLIKKKQFLEIHFLNRIFLGDAVKLDLNGWSIDARGIYVVAVLASLGFFTFTCERCAQIIRLIITCLNTPVENQRREK